MSVIETEKTSKHLEQEMNLVRYKRALSRRSFFERVGMASAGIAGLSLINGCLQGSSQAQTASQADVLNFALNLEYLEAEFYIKATTGGNLSAADTGAGAPATTGGGAVPFADTRVRDIANEIANDELLHVRFLRTALGAAAVAKPAINLSALGIGFANDAEFLTLARAFEDVGVSAYSGAATLLSGDNLQAAAQILATEAYHAGNIRLSTIQKAITQGALDAKDQPATSTNYFPVDANGLAIRRTTSEVLAIVYANSAAGTSSGGFFPSGLNGSIKTV